MNSTLGGRSSQFIREETRMRSGQYRRRIKTDSHDEYSHTLYIRIPEPDADTSRFATILYVWLALLIAAALIGYSLQALRISPSITPKNHVRQAPI
jgi:hypothetical protein